MRKIILFIFVLFSATSFAQETVSDLINKYNLNRVPYISVQELAMPKTNTIILDAREIEEFNVSHIKEALFVGYDDFKLESIQNKLSNKNDKIVVYCSLGIRSEDIAYKLKKAGYTDVLNLYGGIFEWKNNDFPVYDLYEKETENIHVFSKEWSQWLLKGIKVYE